ncbi:MAG: hypothetical protein ACE37H_13610 [Phycisphaeraceae bacterium]
MQSLYLWLWRIVPGNPQVVRIVQGASRRNQHALARISYLLILIAIVFIGLIAGGGLTGSGDLSDLAKAGAQVFRVVAMGQVVLVCLLAPIFMAGAIASEQSGKTYAILLTTPLTNLQIVLGSLIGRLFFILALLFSGLPLFAVMLIFGGVPVRSIFIAFAVAALTALFVGAVAVLLSVMRAGGRKAVFAFVVSIAAYLVVVGALDMVLLRNLGTPGQTTLLTPVHPLLVLEASINRANYAPPGPEQLTRSPAIARFYLGQPFAAFTTITAGGSLAIVLFCSLWVRRIGAGDSRLAIWVKTKLRVAGGMRRRQARSLGTGNPVAWREANTRGKLAGGILARYGFVTLGLVGLGLLMYYYHFDPGWDAGQRAPVNAFDGVTTAPEWFRQALTALLITEVAVITLVALYMAAGSVSKEREDGTLDIMLTTPITPKYYIWGKLRGLVRFLSVMIALPVVTLTIVAAYSFAGKMMQWPQATALQEVDSYQTYPYGMGTPTTLGGTVNPTPLVYLETPLLLIIMLVPFVAVCVAIGMFSSLRAKGVLGAIVPSVSIVGGGALVLGFAGLMCASNMPLIGPILNAFSPATNIVMLVDPNRWVDGFDEDPSVHRVVLFIAALGAAAGYATIVWAIITAMVKGFDHTVRRLSGTK